MHEDNSFAYLIYRAMVDQFITKFNQGATQLPQGVANITDLTLQNLLDSDAKLKSLFQNGVGFVQVTASLADAKRAMDKIEKCGDVFVTTSGDRKDPILGWITDNKILELARV
ncbi:MAG: hypothetical protein JO279_05665 [Verrucomicrobia bacterium]|nr:hypothetical protein [Verrucomicrobiota bacterium]